MGRKRARNLIEDLSSLAPATAQKILIELVEQCPEVAPILSVLVKEAASQSDLDTLSRTIEETVTRTFAESEPRQMRDRRQREVDPTEEISDLLIEALGPFVERLVNLLNRENDSAALNLCLAIILALYKSKASDAVLARVRGLSEEELDDEFASAAEWASRLWRTAGDVDRASVRDFDPERTIPEEFVEQLVPEWDWLLNDD